MTADTMPNVVIKNIVTAQIIVMRKKCFLPQPHAAGGIFAKKIKTLFI